MNPNLMHRLLVAVSGLAAMFALPLCLAVAGEPTLGNLFSTPKDRAVLDQSRQKPVKSRVDIVQPVEEQVVDQITLDGFVRKNNGKTTVWINKTPQHEKENPRGITLLGSDRNSRSVSMQLPSGRVANLKAGQTLDATNGKVTEVYNEAPPVTKAQEN